MTQPVDHGKTSENDAQILSEQIAAAIQQAIGVQQFRHWFDGRSRFEIDGSKLLIFGSQSVHFELVAEEISIGFHKSLPRLCLGNRLRLNYVLTIDFRREAKLQRRQLPSLKRTRSCRPGSPARRNVAVVPDGVQPLAVSPVPIVGE